MQHIANPFGFAERSVVQSRTANGLVYRWESTEYYIDGVFHVVLWETFPLDCLAIWLWFRLPVYVSLARKAIEKSKQRRAEDRLARGLCPVCAYDLRATPNRCPECGTVIHPPAAENPTGPPSTAL